MKTRIHNDILLGDQVIDIKKHLIYLQFYIFVCFPPWRSGMNMSESQVGN